jgi:hypothetical protein
LLASIPHGIAEELLILVRRFDRAMIAASSTEALQWSNNGAAAVTPSVE